MKTIKNNQLRAFHLQDQKRLPIPLITMLQPPAQEQEHHPLIDRKTGVENAEAFLNQCSEDFEDFFTKTSILVAGEDCSRLVYVFNNNMLTMFVSKRQISEFLKYGVGSSRWANISKAGKWFALAIILRHFVTDAPTVQRRSTRAMGNEFFGSKERFDAFISIVEKSDQGVKDVTDMPGLSDEAKQRLKNTLKYYNKHEKIKNVDYEYKF